MQNDKRVCRLKSLKWPKVSNSNGRSRLVLRLQSITHCISKSQNGLLGSNRNGLQHLRVQAEILETLPVFVADGTEATKSQAQNLLQKVWESACGLCDQNILKWGNLGYKKKKSCITVVSTSIEREENKVHPNKVKEDSKEGRYFSNRGQHDSRLPTLATSIDKLKAAPVSRKCTVSRIKHVEALVWCWARKVQA